MAITLPADMYVRTAALPVMQYQFFKSMQLLQGFMGADAMAPVVVDNLDFIGAGYYADQAVLNPITGLIQVRDYVNGGNALTAAKIQSRNDNGVIVRFTALSNIGTDAWRIGWGLSEQRLADHFFQQTSMEWIALMQTYVIGIAKAAIGSMSGTPHTKTVWNASSRTNLSNSLILNGLSTLTDKQQMYFGQGKGVMVTRAETTYDLGIGQLGSGVAGIADVMVRQGTPQTNGIPFVIAQDASLTVADAGFDKYYALFMGPGAMRIKLETPRVYAPDQRLDTNVVTNFLRCDMDAYFEIPGKQWDKTNGGDNPSSATIMTGSNWDDTYADAREVAMFITESNYSGN